MKIINQSYEIKLLADFKEQACLIESCGRTAYQSEDVITENSALAFVKMIKDRNHGAVLEHSMMTVKFITDRGVSHELVRHRLASFTQESTRYCAYNKDKFDSQITIVRPIWVPETVIGEWPGSNNKDDVLARMSTYTNSEHIWLLSMLQAETSYLSLLEGKWTAQQARSVLPNSLKTSIAVTANIREWLHIFQLRAIDKAAHPQMRDLMIPLYEECRLRAPYLFDLGDPK